jgi:hypothetical protein
MTIEDLKKEVAADGLVVRDLKNELPADLPPLSPSLASCAIGHVQIGCHVPDFRRQSAIPGRRESYVGWVTLWWLVADGRSPKEALMRYRRVRAAMGLGESTERLNGRSPQTQTVEPVKGRQIFKEAA